MSGEQLEPGTLLNDRYRILRVIGKGGMGTVYQAEHVRLDTILAVKEVRAPQTADTDAQSLLEQCQHEARFLVRLHHPNLPQVTDAFLENDRFFVVMEYIEGVTLEARERMAGPHGLPVRTVIEWALQIADVLSYLHSVDPPIIFRDLKPANVMIQEDGRIRLIDFGIARRFQPGAVKDTNLLGSVGYSPPEQFGRHQTDTRTDIYAFGATLHNLFTGKDPSHSPFKFASVSSLNPMVPERLSALIDCCVRLDAGARPQSIHEVAMELLAIRDQLPSGPPEMQLAIVESSPGTSAGGSAKIILTNPSLRNTGKTGHGSQRVGTQRQESASQGLDRSGYPGPASGSAPHPMSATVSGKMPDSAGGHVSSAPQWVAGILGVTALCGVVAWMLRPAAVRQPPARNGFAAGTVQPQLPPTTTGGMPSPPATAPAGPPATTPTDSGAVPLTTFSRAVTFAAVSVKGLVSGQDGRPAVRIVASGMALGQPGDQIVIASFFYDMRNLPITSQLPQTPFSSKDGKLSVATTLPLTSERQPFEISLDLPAAAVPSDITGGLQFHCVAFYGDQRIGESKSYTPLPAEMLSGGTGATPPGPDGPPDSGHGTPANPPPARPGTFGTHRGGGDD